VAGFKELIGRDMDGLWMGFSTGAIILCVVKISAVAMIGLKQGWTFLRCGEDAFKRFFSASFSLLLRIFSLLGKPALVSE
jgi:hypothetical protein